MKDRGSNPRWRVFFFFYEKPDARRENTVHTEHLPFCLYGGVAHMVEHSLCMRGARGSIPRTSIFFIFDAIDQNDINILNIDDMRLPMRKTIQKTTTAGFEPTLPKGNCLAGNRLNHSATLSSTIDTG